nr:hypothetical protein [Pseudomonas syringae group genomosp. 3]
MLRDKGKPPGTPPPSQETPPAVQLTVKERQVLEWVAIGVGDITDTRLFGSDRALSYQQYSPQVRGDVVEGGVGDGDQAGGYFGGVNHFLYERT